MERDREKWNARYDCSGFYLGPAPSPFLSDNVDLIKRLVPGRRALDIACGEGRNSIFLAKQGFDVTAVDISDCGIKKARRWAEDDGLSIDFRIEDLDGYILSDDYDLIINFNFLLRPLLVDASSRLSPNGVLVVDTILDSPFVAAPGAKEYLLHPQELLQVFSMFSGSILHAEERPFAATPTAKILFWNCLY